MTQQDREGSGVKWAELEALWKHSEQMPNKTTRSSMKLAALFIGELSGREISQRKRLKCEAEPGW